MNLLLTKEIKRNKIMKLYKIILLSIVVFLNGCNLTNQSKKNDNFASIKSCYDTYGIDNINAIKNNVYIIIDQTFILDEHLKEHVIEKISPLLVNGNKINIIKFSTFSEGHYTSVVSKDTIETKLTNMQRDDIANNKLKKFDRCMEYKLQAKKKEIPISLMDTLNESNETISHSEIFKTLLEVSNLHSFKKPKGNKIIILVSDMLENSSISSFYTNNSVKMIQYEKEMKVVKKAEYLPDFKDASVYVIGAGLLSMKARNQSNSNIKKLNKLKIFWKKYFKESNADLYGFGMPELLGDVE